ncbi:hypothetical protein PFLA_b1277 [Pseudoalteromonas flavipulchra NCIMB 2033 = ATCC BAA-314]|nr:hypothetical protein [Pseudoalteromonas flavipulchra NCIMB 2033 = ATCC BAA-314]
MRIIFLCKLLQRLSDSCSAKHLSLADGYFYKIKKNPIKLLRLN